MKFGRVIKNNIYFDVVYYFVIVYYIYIYCKEFSDNFDVVFFLNFLLIDRIGRRYIGVVNSCGMVIFFFFF